MKKHSERDLQEIIKQYGSLEAYNEEQRRCSLYAVENSFRANPYGDAIRLDNAGPINLMQGQAGNWYFWLKLFGQRA